MGALAEPYHGRPVRLVEEERLPEVTCGSRRQDNFAGCLGLPHFRRRPVRALFLSIPRYGRPRQGERRVTRCENLGYAAFVLPLPVAIIGSQTESVSQSPNVLLIARLRGKHV